MCSFRVRRPVAELGWGDTRLENTFHSFRQSHHLLGAFHRAGESPGGSARLLDVIGVSRSTGYALDVTSGDLLCSVRHQCAICRVHVLDKDLEVKVIPVKVHL
jgi:hypothetical protein